MPAHPFQRNVKTPRAADTETSLRASRAVPHVISILRLPLIDPDRSSRVVAWRGSRGVCQDQFLRDVRALARRLPTATHALNICEDRYRFMVAFAAVCMRGQTNLLPPSRACRRRRTRP